MTDREHWRWWRRLAARVWPWSTLERCRIDGVPHDFHKGSGGTGHPCHFTIYVCTKCEREFGI